MIYLAFSMVFGFGFIFGAAWRANSSASFSDYLKDKEYLDKIELRRELNEALSAIAQYIPLSKYSQTAGLLDLLIKYDFCTTLKEERCNTKT